MKQPKKESIVNKNELMMSQSTEKTTKFTSLNSITKMS